MNPQAFIVSDKEFFIDLRYFVHKDYSFIHKEVWFDVFATKYKGQQIRILVHDGDNLEYSGFTDFLDRIVKVFSILADKIVIEKHGGPVTPYKQIKINPKIFQSTGDYVPNDFNKDLSSAAFVGLIVGRFNPTRLRLAYELDQQFPGDNFLIFQPSYNTVNYLYRNFSDLYNAELEWLKNKSFHQDLTRADEFISWTDSMKTYCDLWNKFQIEIVSETDAMSDYWFTEKTARCLATGKPFVLISGPNSLAELKNLGFLTFDSVLDESYDKESNPTDRIFKALTSLNNLYTDPNKQHKIKTLYDIAKQNITLYNHIRHNLYYDYPNIQLHPDFKNYN